MADPTYQVNITEPPDFLKDYYAALAQKGMDLGANGFTSYSGQRVSPWNTQQQSAADMIQTRAMSGSPYMSQAGSWYSNMLGGKNGISPVASGGVAVEQQNPYASQNNPYLQNSINQAAGDITSRLDSKFSKNAFGGTAHQQTLARELGNMENQMRMQDYSANKSLAENAVNRNLQTQQFNIGNQNAINQFNAGLQGQNLGFQQQAMAFAPTLAGADYQDANALMGVGNQIYNYNQQIADANYNEFLRSQQWPGQQLAYMQAGLNPTASAYATNLNQGTAGSNKLASALGGGMIGYGAGSSLGMSNPWLGAAGGALLGGMFG